MLLEEWLAIGIPDEVAEQAMRWIAKLDSDGCSLNEQEQFQCWLEEDPIHLWAFEELSEFWAKSSFVDLNLEPETSSIHVINTVDEDDSQYTRYEKSVAFACLFVVVGLLASLF